MNHKHLRAELKKAGFSLRLRRDGNFEVFNAKMGGYLVYSSDDFATMSILRVGPNPHRAMDIPNIQAAINHVRNCPE